MLSVELGFQGFYFFFVCFKFLGLSVYRFSCGGSILVSRSEGEKMGSKWKKAKLALGLNLCLFVPRTLDDDFSPPATEVSERLSDAALLSPVNWDMASSQPTTTMPSFYGLKLSKSGSKSSKVGVSLCQSPYYYDGGFRNFIVF